MWQYWSRVGNSLSSVEPEEQDPSIKFRETIVGTVNRKVSLELQNQANIVPYTLLTQNME